MKYYLAKKRIKCSKVDEHNEMDGLENITLAQETTNKRPLYIMAFT